MRTIHILARTLLSLAAIAAGMMLAGAWHERIRLLLFDAYDLVGRMEIWTWRDTAVGVVLGVLLILLGLLAIVPWSRNRKKERVISYPSPRGNTTIQLDSVERSLVKAMSALPEIGKIKVRLIPSDDNRSVYVEGALLELKKSSGIGVREETNRIRQFLEDSAVDHLGADEVLSVSLNVEKVSPRDGGVSPPPASAPVVAAAPSTAAAAGLADDDEEPVIVPEGPPEVMAEDPMERQEYALPSQPSYLHDAVPMEDVSEEPDYAMLEDYEAEEAPPPPDEVHDPEERDRQA